MSRRKKGQERLGSATPEAEQLNRLVESMDTCTKHSIQCFVCGEAHDGEDISEQQFARQLHLCGWRWVHSEALNSEVPMCRECAEMPDAKRAE